MSDRIREAIEDYISKNLTDEGEWVGNADGIMQLLAHPAPASDARGKAWAECRADREPVTGSDNWTVGEVYTYHGFFNLGWDAALLASQQGVALREDIDWPHSLSCSRCGGELDPLTGMPPERTQPPTPVVSRPDKNMSHNSARESQVNHNSAPESREDEMTKRFRENIECTKNWEHHGTFHSEASGEVEALRFAVDDWGCAHDHPDILLDIDAALLASRQGETEEQTDWPRSLTCTHCGAVLDPSMGLPSDDPTPSEMVPEVGAWIDEWVKSQGFESWAVDHVAVLRNMRKWLAIHAPRPEASGEVEALREALSEAGGINSMIRTIEQHETWEGGIPDLGTAKMLGTIKNISERCAALARQPKDAPHV